MIYTVIPETGFTRSERHKLRKEFSSKQEVEAIKYAKSLVPRLHAVVENTEFSYTTYVGLNAVGVSADVMVWKNFDK